MLNKFNRIMCKYIQHTKFRESIKIKYMQHTVFKYSIFLVQNVANACTYTQK